MNDDRLVELLLSGAPAMPLYDLWRLTRVLRAHDSKGQLPGEVNERFWRAACLVHLLDEYQASVYFRAKSFPASVRKRMWMIARRVGKSFVASCLITEKALLPHPQCPTPTSVQHLAAPTQQQVRDFLVPSFDVVHASCPKDLRPEWSTGHGETPPGYAWPHGAYVRIAGCENRRQVNRLRGAYSDDFWVDEAASVPAGELNYLVNSVALYMIKGRPGASVTMYSNAPESTAHSIVGLRAEAKRRGAYIHGTIYDSPRYTPEEIEELADEVGGKHTATWIRESLAELCSDDDKSFVPEWGVRADQRWVVETDQRAIPGTDPPRFETFEVARAATADEWAHEPLVRAVERPAHVDWYLVHDPGVFPSLAAVQLGYWNFEEQVFVVEYEWAKNQASTSEVAMAMRQLMSAADIVGSPYMSIMDVQKQAHLDLAVEHGLVFTLANNADFNSHRNYLRRWVREGKLTVHPRCVETVAHLHGAYLDPKSKKLAWPTKDPVPGERFYGHFDLAATLALLVPHINTSRDPRPSALGWDGQSVTGSGEAAQRLGRILTGRSSS